MRVFFSLKEVGLLEGELLCWNGFCGVILVVVVELVKSVSFKFGNLIFISWEGLICQDTFLFSYNSITESFKYDALFNLKLKSFESI